MSTTIAERVEQVQERIEQACSRSGRNRQDVSLMAVAKNFGPDAVGEAADAGVRIIGENRIQEASQKIPLCPGHLTWHLVGHLQTNKVRHAVTLFSMVHSVDSWKLLEALQGNCVVSGLELPVCLEVNVSGEASKFGLEPQAVPDVLERAEALRNVNIVGLMTVPPFSEDSERSRSFFSKLREYRDSWRERSGYPLDVLSMGMSGDFDVAIEEGATIVRVGTALFGQRNRQT